MKLDRKRWTLIGGAALLLAIVAFALRPKALLVETARAVRAPLETTVDADGRTRVRERYVVTAPVAGRLQRITLVEGDTVRAGDVVARIAPLPLDASSTAQARSRVDAANAMAREAATRVRITQAVVDQRRRELARARRLGEAGGVSPRVIEDAELAMRQAEEDARAAAEHERAAQADVRQALAALVAVGGGEAEVVVRSPSSGRVLRIPERSERVLPAGAPLVEIGDPSTLEVIADVLSSDGATIHPGDTVRLSRWAGENAPVLTGTVRYVEPAAFTKVSALGVDEQRVNVIIDVAHAPRALGDGFRVEASIVTWTSPAVVLVPMNALVRHGSEWSTFVVQGGRARRRVLQIGHVGTTAVEVLGGLAADDEVVLFPSDLVIEGARISGRRG